MYKTRARLYNPRAPRCSTLVKFQPERQGTMIPVWVCSQHFYLRVFVCVKVKSLPLQNFFSLESSRDA